MCQYSGDICVLHWPAGCQDSGSNGLPKGDETSICCSPRFPALKVGLIQRQYQRALSGTPCKEGFVKDSTVISPEITFKPFLEVFSCSVFYSGYMSRIHALHFFLSFMLTLVLHHIWSLAWLLFLQRGWEAEAGMRKHLGEGLILAEDHFKNLVLLFLFPFTEGSFISLGSLNPGSCEET